MNNSVVAPFDVTAVADLFLDVIMMGPQKPVFGQVELLMDDYDLELGGSVGIFASQFAKLGGRVKLLGAVGNDPAGKLLTERLDAAGVDTESIAIESEAKTPLGINISVKGDRALLTYLGTIGRLTEHIFGQVNPGSFRHWHLGSYFLLQPLMMHWPSWLQRVKAAGRTVSLDTNWDPATAWEGIDALLPFVDVFLPNEAEAMAIVGTNDLRMAGEWLSQRCPLVVIKCGEKGAMVFSKGRITSYPVPEALLNHLEVKDTTGAGDNFDAGFIHRWLENGTIDACVEQGTACAVNSLRYAGGINGQLTKRHE